MKLGFGLYKHQLNREHYDFAVQCGATHAVVHLVDYFYQGAHIKTTNQPVGDLKGGWGLAGGTAEAMWTATSLKVLKQEINDAGLALEAIENFDPVQWHDVLLDGPKKVAQLEGLKQIIRNVGEAGIPIFGYNFSIAGVSGRITTTSGRGGATTVMMDGENDGTTTPLPQGMVWNMVYDSEAPEGMVTSCTHEALWARLQEFLEALVPVAEEAGVRLAAHPDDPPLPYVRQQPRLVYQPELYQRLIELVPSKSNSLEFCLGTLGEMTEGDLYEACDRHSRQGDIAYIHLRNVRGSVPHYQETFIDEGDLDIPRIIGILRKNNYDGILIPDHAPQMTCPAPWHAGMAHAMGYLKAVIERVE